MINIEEILKGNYEHFTGKKDNIITQDKIFYINKMKDILWLTKLAEELGMSKQTLSDYFKKLNISYRTLNGEERGKVLRNSGAYSHEKLSDYDKQYIKEFAKERTISQLVDDLNISYYKINKYITKNNIKCLKYNSNEDNREKISKILEYKDNLVPSEIAKRLNVTKSYVYNVLKKHDVLYLCTRIDDNRLNIIEKCLSRGITDINQIKKECLVIYDTLERELPQIKANFALKQKAKDTTNCIEESNDIIEKEKKLPSLEEINKTLRFMVQDKQNTIIRLNTEVYELKDKLNNCTLELKKLQKLQKSHTENQNIVKYIIKDNNKIGVTDIQYKQLKNFSRCIDKIVSYSNKYSLNKDIIYYIFEENGFSQFIENINDFVKE